MGFPGQQAKDPWRMAQAMEEAGFVQEVVIATTRLLHGEVALTPRDRGALTKCRDLLLNAESPDQPTFGEPQLEPSNSPSLMRAARTAQPSISVSFEDAVSIINAVLEDGDLDPDGLKVIGDLRDLFLAIGEANLKSITATRHSRRDLGLWKPLTTSSTS
jgi:hypothetical protein